MRTQFVLDTEDRLEAWMAKSEEGPHIYLDLYEGVSKESYAPNLWFRLSRKQAFKLLDDLKAALRNEGEE